MYLSNSKKQHTSQGLPPKKRFDGRGDSEDWDSSREGSSMGSPARSTGKRKHSDREPESPGDLQDDHPSMRHYAKKEKTYSTKRDLDDDSPSSYPRHVIVPNSEGSHHHHRSGGDYSQSSTPSRKGVSSLTPQLTPESISNGGMHNRAAYDPPYYPRHGGYYGSDGPYYGSDQRGYGYPPEGDMGGYGGPSPPHNQREVQLRPKRWACDYCGVATFLSYEEACAHEEVCARHHHRDHYGPTRIHPRPPPMGGYCGPAANGGGGGGGLDALYHASQGLGGEGGGPVSPGDRGMWNSRPVSGPPLPLLPSEQPYHRGPPPHGGYRDGYGRYEMEENYPPHYPPHHGGGYHGGHHHNAHHNQPYHHHHPNDGGRSGGGNHHQPPVQQEPRKRMLLSLPGDSDSLSDRQCYVRTNMVEIFAATEKDVAARHTKGAQKLVIGQVGIRCVHCSHLRSRDRAERAVCYPSSISRIYQTVADMQRFHFEQCAEIPDETRSVYKSLKTTRPRGVGSPQTYWIQSAKLLGLQDSSEGIRFEGDTTASSNVKSSDSAGSQPQQSDGSMSM